VRVVKPVTIDAHEGLTAAITEVFALLRRGFMTVHSAEDAPSSNSAGGRGALPHPATG
jgi:transposase-like protein